MELDSKEMSRVWWKGAFKGAMKGLPQGLLLGALAGVAMFGMIAAMIAIGGPVGGIGLTIAQGMGSFVYGHAAVAQLAALTPASTAAALPIVTSLQSISLLTIAPFNAVLGAVGNFLSGGNIAVNAHKQQIDHDANVVRLDRLEGREKALEQEIVAPQRSAAMQRIIANGPRRATGFEQAEIVRAAIPPQGPTIH